MPQIFDEEKRTALRKQMLKNGFELIKKYGYKKTSVEDITKMSGISKGTFYNFFTTKEEFVHEIIVHKRDCVKNEFQKLLDKKGYLDRTSFKKYLGKIVFNDNNLFAYLNEDEIAILNTRWPKEYFINDTNDEKTSTWILSHITGLSPKCDWRIFANYMKAIAIIQANSQKLIQEVYTETLNCLIENVLEYIFK